MKHWGTLSILLAIIMLAFAPTVLAQNFEIPITVTDGSNTTTLYFGIVPGTDICILPTDGFNGHFEQNLPPPPPGGVFDARFIAPVATRPPACYDQGSPNDFRPFSSSTQVDTFRVRQQLGGGTTMTFSWPAGLAAFFDVMTLRFFDGSGNVNVNMLTSTSQDVTLAGDGGPVTIFTAGPNPPPNPGPCFGATPGSLNFGSIAVGGNATLPVTVSNSGNANPLNITSILFAAPYSITPLTAVIPPGGSQVFNVTFAPTIGGPAPSVITFNYDPLHPDCGGGTSTAYNVTGTGSLQGGTLEFTQAAVIRCDNTDGYMSQLQLAAGYAGASLKALQLKIIVPTALLMNVGGVVRGTSIPSPAWNFSHQMYHFPTYDEIRVVIYGNGSNALASGNASPYNLVKFQYGTANITGPNQAASISLLDVLGSTPLGENAQVVAGPDQVNTIVNSTSAGDVNGDDVLDILDILMIVDHILGRITLVGGEFTRADVAPWPTGDGLVNVQDLALLQNIILTGSYPGSLPCELGLPRPATPIALNGNGGLSKLTPGMDVKLTFHMTTAGIAVRMENAVPVKGLQLEFGRVSAVPANMNVTTLLGEAYYNQVNDLLRVLMYNMQSNVIPPGDNMVGIIPFNLANPRGVTLQNYVVAGAQNNRLEKVEVEFSSTPAPELPIDYLLSQNYPNPFNPTTNIKFAVPQVGHVKIAIYDMLGQEIRTLVSEQMERGTRVVEWNGRDNNGAQVTSGMYIYRMTSGRFVQSHKMMLLK